MVRIADITRRLVLGAAIAVGLAAPAEAATLYISEYANGVTFVGTSQAQVPPEPAITDQSVALSGTSAQSAALNSKTHYVRLICDEGCSILIGTNPTALTTSFLLQQGVQVDLGVSPGQIIAAIANSAGNLPGGGGAITNENIAQINGVTPLMGNGNTGTGSLRVTIAADNTAFSVNSAVADGADVTQGAKADAKSAATDTTPITVMSVLKEISFMAQTPAALPANQSVNVAQINAATPLMGNGNTGTGSLRVTVAADNTAFAVTPTGSFTAADGIALTSALKTASIGQVYNGSTDDLARSIITGTNSTGTGIAAAGLVGQCDDTSPATITENQFGNAKINCTTHGLYIEALPSASAASGIAAVVSTTLETGHVLKNAPGNLYSVTFTTTTVAGYGGVSNTTTVPAAGAVTPVASCYAPAFGTCTIQYSPPLVLGTGISAWFSIAATPFTKTDSATAMITGQVM